MPITSLDRAKQQYLEQQVASATPERLLVLLYDRLLVDIERADASQESGDWAAAGNHLVHAQQIVAELNGSLTDEWDGSAECAAPCRGSSGCRDDGVRRGDGVDDDVGRERRCLRAGRDRDGLG